MVNSTLVQYSNEFEEIHKHLIIVDRSLTALTTRVLDLNGGSKSDGVASTSVAPHHNNINVSNPDGGKENLNEENKYNREMNMNTTGVFDNSNIQTISPIEKKTTSNEEEPNEHETNSADKDSATEMKALGTDEKTTVKPDEKENKDQNGEGEPMSTSIGGADLKKFF